MVTYFLHRYVLLFLFGHLIFSLWKLIELLANHRTACLTLLIYYFVYTRNSINFFKNPQIISSIKDIWFICFKKNSFRCVYFMYHFCFHCYSILSFLESVLFIAQYVVGRPHLLTNSIIFSCEMFWCTWSYIFLLYFYSCQYFYSNHVLLSLR